MGYHQVLGVAVIVLLSTILVSGQTVTITNPLVGNVGGSVEIVCSAFNEQGTMLNPETTVLRRGGVVFMDTRLSRDNDPNRTYTLENLAMEDNGIELQCSAFEFISVQVTLQVLFVGEPPAFVSQQEDVVVSADVLVPVPGAPDNSANLVLQCQVTGTPTPTIAWFREVSPVGAEFVNTDGTLAMNVTEPEQATESGTTYYCLATNSIGSSRSRDVIVSLTFFNGFDTTGRVDVPTVLRGSVALECDYLDAKPSPEVEWFMNNGSMKTEEVPEQNQLLFLEGGRYLFIRTLTVAQRSAFFHCEVVNAYLGTAPQRSPTTYYLSEDLPVDVLRVYRPVREMTAIPGQTETVVYVAALATTGGVEAPLVLSCDIDTSDVVVLIVNDVVATFTGLDGTETNREATVNCQVVGISPPLTQPFTFLISEPAAITSTVTAPAPAGGAGSLVDRDRLVGGGAVSYMCMFEGIPSPTVTWYFNGERIPTDSGISENGNQVVIAAPLVVHSGVYQCVVSNVIDGVVQEDRRAWVVEVREPPGNLTIIPSKPLSVLLGDYISLNCSSTPPADADISYTWTHLNTSTVLEETSNILTFPRISVEELGTYRCSASSHFPADVTITSARPLIETGSYPARTISGSCPSPQSSDDVIVDVLQLLSAQFGVHPLGLTMSYSAESCDQVAEANPGSPPGMYWIYSDGYPVQVLCQF